MSGKNNYPIIDHCSDVHFFNPRVPTEHIIATMDYFYPPNSKTRSLDVISIGGDLFDTTILFSDKDAQLFIGWAIRFLQLCADFDIELWVLEGTPRHDRRQSSWLVTLNESYGIKAPLKYFTGISHYYCERINKHVLFIQDELTTDSDLTYQLAVKTIKDAGLDKVDIISMHGMFDYQAPENIKIKGVHNSDLYQNLVNDFIVAGHVHTSSFHDKIIVAGSSTRLKHGEEEAKGHVRIEYFNEHNFKATFKKNEIAMIFSDFLVGEEDVEEQALRSRLNALTYPEGSYVRVIVKKENSHLFPLSFFNDNRRDYNWSKKELKSNNAEVSPIFEELSLAEVSSEIEINQNNILDIITNRLSSKYDESTIQGCISVIQEVINQNE